MHSIRALSSRSLRHPLGIIEDFNIKNCRDGAANVFRSRDARNRVEPGDRLYKKYETIIVRVILPESSGVSRTFVLLDTSCSLRLGPPEFRLIKKFGDTICFINIKSCKGKINLIQINKYLRQNLILLKLLVLKMFVLSPIINLVRP